MSENLTLPGFEPMESSPTSSAEASPALTSRSQARVPVWKVSSLDCGESLRVSLASFDHATSLWKTLGLFADEDSSTFSETLPRSLMWDRHTLYQLPPLVHLTFATVSGSSPDLVATPTATMADRGGRGDLIQQMRGNVSPSGHYKPMLPTPTANDYGSTNNGHRPDGSTYRTAGKPSLSTMARHGLIPTPTASDANSSGSRNTDSSKAHPGVSLTDWARGDGGTGRLNLEDWVQAGGPGLLPSPGASDDKNCADYSDGSRGHSPQLRHLGKGRLNPNFVEWLMGFPKNWTEV